MKPNIIDLPGGKTSTLNNSDIVDDLRYGMKRNPDNVVTLHDLMNMIDTRGNLSPIYQFAEQDLKSTRHEVNKAIKRYDIQQEKGYYPADVQDFVHQYIKHKGFIVPFNGEIKHDLTKVNYKGNKITREDLEIKVVRDVIIIEYGGQVATQDLIEQLILENAISGYGFKDAHIGAALNQWTRKQRKIALQEIFGKISFCQQTKKEMHDEWLKLVNSAFDLSQTRSELAVAVLQKFIWQVKRKIRKIPVTNHLMPVFFGPQGTGKSTLAKDLLCGPINDLMKSTDFVGICDDKNLDLFEYYVLFLDEMDKAGRVDSGTIKRRITESSITTRLHHTHSVGQRDNHATFIGTSNLPIDQVITDSTGTRRFFQLDMLENAKNNWHVFNEINWLKLWRSVDEDSEDPTKQYMNEIQAIQNTDRARSITEDWVWWVSEHHPQEMNQYVLCKDLYHSEEAGQYSEKRIADWCFANYQNKYAAHVKISESHFGKELTRLCKSNGSKFPLSKKEERTNSGYKYCWIQNNV